jgi:hypothetical protein
MVFGRAWLPCIERSRGVPGRDHGDGTLHDDQMASRWPETTTGEQSERTNLW